MLKKLVVASATVAAAAGLGLATPAYADGPAEIACVISDTGKTANSAAGSGFGLLAGLGALNISDILSNRDVEVDCRPDKQINYNQHYDSHQGHSRH